MNQSGRKFDTDKPRVDLLIQGMPNALEAIARVLTFGAEKYDAHNWQHVSEPHRRYLAAAMRHELKLARGEKNDPESGEHHLAHAACCLLFRLELALSIPQAQPISMSPRDVEKMETTKFHATEIAQGLETRSGSPYPYFEVIEFDNTRSRAGAPALRMRVFDATRGAELRWVTLEELNQYIQQFGPLEALLSGQELYRRRGGASSRGDLE